MKLLELETEVWVRID